jgi:hypothetical protein
MRTNIDVHYTWVGPTNREDKDVQGAFSMAQKLRDTDKYTYTMYFWCLDRYVGDFQRKFQRHPRVTVRGMESFLATCTGLFYRWRYWYGDRENDAVKKVKDIITASVPARGWDGARGRDVVNAKNVWSFFVLYTWGGYHFDAGIKPDEHARLNLPAYQTFKAPGSRNEEVSYQHRNALRGIAPMCSSLIREGAGFFGVNSDDYMGSDDTQYARHYDVWALYSPRYDARAWLALSWYCRAWQFVRDARIQNDEEYKQAYRSAVMNAVYTALSHDSQGHCAPIHDPCCWEWKDKHLVPELGIEKMYYGMHR